MRIIGMLIVGLLATTAARAQVAVGNLQDQAVEWLQDYVRLDTINPPGNEIAGARFLAAIFEAEGIPYEMAESHRVAATSGHGWTVGRSRG